MSHRLVLPVLALVFPLLLAACQKDAAAPADDSAGTAPATAKVADAASADAAAATANAVDPAAAALVDAAIAAAATSPAPVAGTDYVEIPGGQPFEPLNGQIELVEVFGYVCPACARFQPLVHAWKGKLPDDVRITYVPALFGGTWDTYARAYYAAESLGLLEKTHNALYNAIHIEQSLKGERGQDAPADIAAFHARFGADPKQFTDAMGSFAIDGKLNRAKQFAQRSGVEGTPTLIVNGKYRVIGGSTYEDILRITQQLIAQERAAQPK